MQAACCGLYALRPSPTACDVGGMVGLAGTLDAPAFLAQTPDGLEGIVRALQLPGGAHEASPWLAMLSVPKCPIIWMVTRMPVTLNLILSPERVGPATLGSPVNQLPPALY